MAKVSTLKQLKERHNESATAIENKENANYRNKPKQDATTWIFYSPNCDKQLGRSKRIFDRLISLG
jgi:hypothetical protein